MSEPDRTEPGDEDLRAPFSFRLMIALTVIYLGYRLVQGIFWLVDHLGS
jgi:hypothetical protein